MEPMALWKRLLILLVCVWGIIAATPNLFYAKVERHNDAVAAIEAAGGTSTAELDAEKAQWPDYLPSSSRSICTAGVRSTLRARMRP